ncbi:SCO family protein [Limibacter armeniacum]|uniref:SCO family protein n=1 Tax=Limibacter armeniacum TaxID=466084 RepID=UPI002FE534CA
MKRGTQILLLAILLLAPVLIFGFLKLFGENKYALNMINPAELKVYSMKAVNCESNEVDGVHRIPDFSFTNQDGKVITNKDYEGKIYVADFFFATCPDICIVMTSELLRVQEKYKDNPDVKILSHTVNPEHDTPKVLKEYAKSYGADTNMWNFVTGPKEAIYEQARCGYFVTAKPEENNPDDFIHSDKLILVDKENRIRGFYSGTDRDDVDRLITEINLLMQEYE